MSTLVYFDDYVTSGDLLTLNGVGDSVELAAYAMWHSTNGRAFVLANAQQGVTVLAGSIASAAGSSTIYMSSATTNGYTFIHGIVRNTNDTGSAINVLGGSSRISIEEGGRVLATGDDSVAIRLTSFDTSAFAEIFNDGNIYGNDAIVRTGAENVQITNNGRIDIISGSAYTDLYGGWDVIINNGFIRGNINFGGGNDVYNGQQGDAGRVYGGSGEDGLYGGDASDYFDGGADNDILKGLGGNDFLYGGSGDDLLDGGSGTDIMAGNAGNDTFRVDNAADVIEELAGEGSDTVVTTVSYALAAGVHVETLQTNGGGGTAPIDLTGNERAQLIIGNNGRNTLTDGPQGGAPDHLRGLSGNDTYRVFNPDTMITESAAQGASDKVIAGVDYTLGAGVHVETLQTNAGSSTASRRLAGNEIAQTIIGNNGDNRLEGKGGNDTLRGLGGDDTFVFADPLGPNNVDTIVDFDPADDRFLLSNDVFSAFGDRTGAIAPGHLRVNTSGQAQDASDMIIYESDAGRVWYDADGFGAGARVLFATIDAGLALTNADFVLA